jgi:hypothetical protein
MYLKQNINVAFKTVKCVYETVILMQQDTSAYRLGILLDCKLDFHSTSAYRLGILLDCNTPINALLLITVFKKISYRTFSILQVYVHLISLLAMFTIELKPVPQPDEFLR